MRASISVIIPALNEAEVIGGTLASAAGTRNANRHHGVILDTSSSYPDTSPNSPDSSRQSPEMPRHNADRSRNDISMSLRAELIVVDGGSEDATVEIARSGGAVVVSSPPGRARQMNAGARIAGGEYLLFLHADTRLPPQYEREVCRVLESPGVVAGAFALRIDGAGLGLRLVERAANLRSQLFDLPYGDQGLFLRGELFRSLGGFPELPLLEDLELARRLRRRGRIATSPLPVLTSARRWESLGVVRTTLLNQFFLLAYLVGIPPRKIAHWYQREGQVQIPNPKL